MFYCHISAIFEDIDLKFCTHIISHCPLTYCMFFENFDFEVENFEKKKNC